MKRRIEIPNRFEVARARNGVGLVLIPPGTPTRIIASRKLTVSDSAPDPMMRVPSVYFIDPRSYSLTRTVSRAQSRIPILIHYRRTTSR
jgi:hypothetical protein